MGQMYILKSNLGKSGMGFSWETMQSILSPANESQPKCVAR